MLPSVTEFLGLLVLLLGGAMIGAALIKKIRYPPVLGFILIGIAIGPFGFGVITDLELVDLLAEFGIVILLFVVGLEFSIGKLREIGGTALIIGLIEQSIMFFVGFIIGSLLGWSITESLYLAGVLAISSTAIAIKLLKDAGILHTKEASTVIGTLIIEDLTAILILAILTNVSSGDVGILEVSITAAETIAFFIITLGIGLKVVPKIIETVDRLDIDEAPFLTALALGFGLAFLANYLGLSTAIGAFLMGMMIASAPKADAIKNKIVPLHDFFVTIFFVSIGMLINISLFPDYVWVSIPIILVAIIGKFTGNFFGAFLSGHSREGSATIGITMIPRGEFSFIIAKQGIDLNAVREAIFPITMLVSFVTIVVVPILMRILPTIRDSRTIIPTRLFAPLELLGTLFRNVMLSFQQREGVAEAMHTIIPKMVINIAIIAALLSALSLTEPYILRLYLTFSSLQIVTYEIFKLMLTVVVLAYPIISIFGKTGKITESLFDSTQRRIIKAPIYVGGMNYVHRIIRNIVTGVAVLLVSSFITPSVSVITDIDMILPISSFITLAVFIYLLLDTFFVINRRMERGIITSLLNPIVDTKEQEVVPKKRELQDGDEKRKESSDKELGL